MKAIYITAKPYNKDAMNLPVADVETAIPFYETIMGSSLRHGKIRLASPLSLVETAFRSVWPRMEATRPRKDVSLKLIMPKQPSRS